VPARSRGVSLMGAETGFFHANTSLKLSISVKNPVSLVNTFAFFRAGTGAQPLHTTDFRRFIVFGEGIVWWQCVSPVRVK